MPKRYQKYPNLVNFSNTVWASLGLFPLEETLIHRILRKELNFENIQPSDVLLWESGHRYTGYITSAFYRNGRQHYQANVFQHALLSLAKLGVHLEKLYVDLSTDKIPEDHIQKGILKGGYFTRLVKEQYFSPLPLLSESAWVVDLRQDNPPPAIQAYQRSI